jgi:RNA polymerase sigma-70 factor (ECF subfamily)
VESNELGSRSHDREMPRNRCPSLENDAAPSSDELAPASQVRPRLPVSAASGEEALLSALKHRNPRAVVVFFERYQHEVRNVLTRLMGASPDVADAMQDTFIRALNGVPHVREALALRMWLRRVAMSVAFDHLRQRRRTRWYYWVDCSAVDERVDFTNAEDHAVFCDIHRVIDKMPDRERTAFYLRYVDEMELKEVAVACRVSVATVKRRLARANLRFRTLAQHQPDLADFLHRQSA